MKRRTKDEGMGTQATDHDARRAVAIDYFRRLDAGREMIDLFGEHAEIHFPKWGIARGHKEIQQMWSEVGVLYRSISHFSEFLNYAFDDSLVFVEGLSDGVAGDGTPWIGGQTWAGRWCDVMEIRDGKIERLYIYLDPDYAGADTGRYPWTTDGLPPVAQTLPAPAQKQYTPMTDYERAALVRDYFQRLDSGVPVEELFADHATSYYPKWGVAHGAAAVRQQHRDVAAAYPQISHVSEYLNIVVDGEVVAVEGLTVGTTVDGTSWRAGQNLSGRFCAIFEVRDYAIERCFTYLDPDLADADFARYPWLTSN